MWRWIRCKRIVYVIYVWVKFSRAHWSLHDAFLFLFLFLTFLPSALCLSSLFTLCVSVSHLMTRCRWSYDSWITASGLITAYVNKPVSYANPNHIWLGETITTEEQQEKEQLDTCFSDSPVSQTFMWTSCQPIWNFQSQCVVTQAGSCGVGTYTCCVFINDCIQSIQTESQDNDIWNFINVCDMKMRLTCVFYFPLFMLPICHPLILDSCFLSSEYTVCSLANLILHLLPNLCSSRWSYECSDQDIYFSPI